MSKTKEIECGKCNGLGKLDCYKPIAGGVCFACQGRGSKTVAASLKPMVRYISHVGSVQLGYINARSDAEALRKALKDFRCRRTAPAYAGLAEEQVSVRVYKA